MPKISIITISFNNEADIEQTIQSVLRNKTDEVEYIIVDGASKDGTMSIVQKYRDSIDKVVSEPDDGIADAFNKGIRMASGQIIGLINAGDLLCDGACAALLAAYRPDIEVYYGDNIVNDVDNDRQYVRKASDLAFIRYALPFCHQSCFIAKAAYEKYGYYSKEYAICMDYALIRKMYAEGAVFAYVPVTLASFSYDGVSYTKPVATVRENMGIACQYGLSKTSAALYAGKYLLRHGTKKLLEKAGLFGLVAKIKDRHQ